MLRAPVSCFVCGVYVCVLDTKGRLFGRPDISQVTLAQGVAGVFFWAFLACGKLCRTRGICWSFRVDEGVLVWSF